MGCYIGGPKRGGLTKMPRCADCGKPVEFSNFLIGHVDGFPDSLLFCTENCAFVWMSERAESREKAGINDDKINLRVIQI
jgi:hypothetical protein